MGIKQTSLVTWFATVLLVLVVWRKKRHSMQTNYLPYKTSMHRLDCWQETTDNSQRGTTLIYRKKMYATDIIQHSFTHKKKTNKVTREEKVTCFKINRFIIHLKFPYKSHQYNKITVTFLRGWQSEMSPWGIWLSTEAKLLIVRNVTLRNMIINRGEVTDSQKCHPEEYDYQPRRSYWQSEMSPWGIWLSTEAKPRLIIIFLRVTFLTITLSGM